MRAIHNSTLWEYKSKIGAVETEEELKIRLFADEEVTAVSLRVYIDDVESRFPMEKQGDFWEIVWKAPKDECVMWYSFVIHSKKGMFYYGADYGKVQGEGRIYNEPCMSFQQTVFKKGFKTPDWAKNGTMYQIFPDRFKRGDMDSVNVGIRYHEKMGRRVCFHSKWNEEPLYLPLDGEEYYSPCDFYGGSLKGIKEELPYLKDMGVSVIYLNPIVEAESNHRYDTADYLQVDRILGTNADFTSLCKAAEKQGIRVILDGVYSHTGSDSRYFNKKGTYKTEGAYQGENSDFYSWYSFMGSRDEYQSWWGFKTLPEVNEHDGKWQDFIIKNDDSVFATWIDRGASGFRLDVADELPDDVIMLMREYLKKKGEDNLLLGEVWEDATTKRSYDVNRRYALGGALDSVMNYPFKEAVISFLKDWSNAYHLEEFLLCQKLNYPKEMYYSLMNLLSSHDVPRIRTVLSTEQNADSLSREEQAAVEISKEEDLNGQRLQKLAVSLQFVIPGMPSVYYGDEFGMQGMKDPFNRRPFTKRDKKMYDFHRKLSNIRQNTPALRTGEASFKAYDGDVISVLRFNLGGVDAFGNQAQDGAVVAFVNRSDEEKELTFDLSLYSAGLSKEAFERLGAASFNSAICISERRSAKIAGGKFEVRLKPQSALIYQLI